MKKKFNLTALLALLSSVAIAVAACDSDDPNTAAEESGPPLSKKQFIAQADEICAEGHAEIQTEAAEQFGDATPTPAERVQFMRTVVADNFEQQLQSIEELTPPEEDQPQVDAFLDALKELIDEARNDPELLFSAQQLPEAARLAQEFGLTNCGF